jgi:hypothetical protein
MPENARASRGYVGILFRKQVAAVNIFRFLMSDSWAANEMNERYLLTEYSIYRNFVAVNQ